MARRLPDGVPAGRGRREAQAPSPIPEVAFETGAPTVVVDHATAVEHGLEHWVDGTMGFHRREGRTIVIAPNGPWIARHELQAGAWGAPSQTKTTIGRQAVPADHASGGPLFHDERSGQLFLVYHGESFVDGDPARYRSFIGLAVSTDEGVSFTDLGPIVTPDRNEGDPPSEPPVEMGPGAFVVHDGWLHVYFQDRGNGPVRRRLGVARASVDDVVASGRGGPPPAFTKYVDGSWSGAGLGGPSSELLDVPWLVWFDLATIEPLGCHLLVYSTSWLVGPTPHWMYMAALSRDGITWSTPVPLLDAPVTDEIIYLTIDSGGPGDQRIITGDTFHLYRTRSAAPYRWDDAWCERLEVRYRLLNPA